MRLLVGGFQRIASHLVATGAYINDLSASTPLLWTFRDHIAM
jgi:NADH:ubiquinone oxidoreductase subunit D